VIIDEENQSMEVIVPDEFLSVAIGKRGQNVRLASKLTGWHLDVKSESRYSQAMKDGYESLMNMEGVSIGLADALYESGLFSVEELGRASVEELMQIRDMDEEKAVLLIEEAQAAAEAAAQAEAEAKEAAAQAEAEAKEAAAQAEAEAKEAASAGEGEPETAPEEDQAADAGKDPPKKQDSSEETSDLPEGGAEPAAEVEDEASGSEKTEMLPETEEEKEENNDGASS
jgi:N utilization substance protein A